MVEYTKSIGPTTALRNSLISIIIKFLLWEDPRTQSEKYDEKHLRTLPEMLNRSCKRRGRILWSNISNAADKSSRVKRAPGLYQHYQYHEGSLWHVHNASVLWPDMYICLCTVAWQVHLPLYCDLTCTSASVLWPDMQICLCTVMWHVDLPLYCDGDMHGKQTRNDQQTVVKLMKHYCLMQSGVLRWYQNSDWEQV